MALTNFGMPSYLPVMMTRENPDADDGKRLMRRHTLCMNQMDELSREAKLGLGYIEAQDAWVNSRFSG